MTAVITGYTVSELCPDGIEQVATYRIDPLHTRVEALALARTLVAGMARIGLPARVDPIVVAVPQVTL